MIRVLLSLVVLLMVFMPGTMPLADTAYPEPAVENTGEVVKAQVAEAYGKLPLLFIENQGQLNAEVKYYVKAAGQTIYFTDGGIVFDLVRYEETQDIPSADSKAERLVFSLDFLSANESPVIEGKVKDEAVVNYFIGNDPEKWQTNIATYREVVYEDVYPEIDLRLYGKEGSLTYDFVVNPGASVTDIALAYTGVDMLGMEAGELVVSTAFGDMRQTKPYIYQEIGDDRVEVRGGFRLATSNTYGFEVASYDMDYPVIIDPALSYSTYLGGSKGDIGHAITVDSSGCAYIAGGTDSYDFPTRDPYQAASAGGWGDVFVTKLSASGDSLVYSTYLGGSSTDSALGIAIDSSGNAYIVGSAGSDDFPTKNAYQAAKSGIHSGFATKLSASGDSLVYSTYLDTGYTSVASIAIDTSGCAYIAAGGSAIKLSSSGDSLVYWVDLSVGSRGIAIDSSGCAYVVGSTASDDLPTKNAYQAAYGGGNSDAFLVKLSASGNSTMYSTYLGGNDNDWGRGVAVDLSGCAYVTGDTRSSDFPTENPFQATHGSGGGSPGDAFVTKIDTTKSGDDSLIYSTYLGGTQYDGGWNIAIGTSGCAYIIGKTSSTNFPTLNSFQTYCGGTDVFVTKLSATGDSLVYSTYLGGSNSEQGYGIAVDSSGCAYVTGNVISTNFPTTVGALDSSYGGVWDAFVTKISGVLGVTPLPLSFDPVLVGSSSAAQAITVTNISDNATTIGTISIAGTDADQFAKQNDTVSNQTLDSGGSATLEVVFSPTSNGAKTAALLIPFTNPGENSVEVPLSRTGVVSGEGAGVSVSATTGTGNVIFQIIPSAATTDNTTIGITPIPEDMLPEDDKPSVSFVHGLFNFIITGVTHGGQVIVSITLPSAIAEGAEYWKYRSSGNVTAEGWVNMTSLLGDDDGDNILTLTLTDGGLGDDDGLADGTITDPGGPGIPPATPTPTPTPGGGASTTWTLPTYQIMNIDMLGKRASARISYSGELLAPVTIADAGNRFTLEFDKGTRILCTNKRAPERIELRQAHLPSPSSDMVIVGEMYELNAYAHEYSSAPTSVTISPSAKMALAYTPDELPENTLSLSIASYDADEGWVELETTYTSVSEAGKATADVSHFSCFALLAEVAEATPAKFAISNVTINPAQAQPNQEITVTAKVTNTGGTAGNYNAVLKINGQVEKTKKVNIEPGDALLVEFAVYKSQPGTYAVDIGGQQHSLTIVGAGGQSADVGSGLVVGIVAFVLVVLLGLLLVFVRRRFQAG